jgi:type IV secretory pathway VirB2 component (pilin)
MKLLQNMQNIKTKAALALLSTITSKVALAGGASLPWDGPLETLRNNLTGPFAASISVIAFVAAGAALIFGGEDMSAIAKRILYIVLGVCVVVFGLQFLSALGIVSAGALI